MTVPAPLVLVDIIDRHTAQRCMWPWPVVPVKDDIIHLDGWPTLTVIERQHRVVSGQQWITLVVEERV